MRNLKEYLTENNFTKNLGVGQLTRIESWLHKNYITKYTINDDYTIDVEENVSLDEYPEK